MMFCSPPLSPLSPSGMDENKVNSKYERACARTPQKISSQSSTTQTIKNTFPRPQFENGGSKRGSMKCVKQLCVISRPPVLVAFLDPKEKHDVLLFVMFFQFLLFVSLKRIQRNTSIHCSCRVFSPFCNAAREAGNRVEALRSPCMERN